MKKLVESEEVLLRFTFVMSETSIMEFFFFWVGVFLID